MMLVDSRTTLSPMKLKWFSSVPCLFLRTTTTTTTVLIMIISTVCYLLAHLALTVAYFHIQELCADYPEVDKRIFRTGRFRKSIQLEIPRIGSSSSYFLSKPHNLRVAESRESESQNVFIIQTSHSLVVNFTSLNLDHEGNYSLYQFVFNSNGSNRVLIGRSRFDFNLVISGESEIVCWLKGVIVVDHCSPPVGLGIGNYCQEDNQCASGRCHIICRCNSSNPIFIAGHYPNCYQGKHTHTHTHPVCVSCNWLLLSARNYNQTCTNHEECMQTGGINAECYRGWRRCRCKPNTFPIRLTNNHRFCGKIGKIFFQIVALFIYWLVWFFGFSETSPTLSVFSPVQSDWSESLL